MPPIDPEILARAERAVAALGDGFTAQAQQAIDAQRECLNDIAGLPDAEALRGFFTFAHDLRGQGGSFGYPALTAIGDTLCRFLEARDGRAVDGDDIVIRTHFDAAAAVLAGGVHDESDPVARALVESLDQLVRKRLTGQS